MSVTPQIVQIKDATMVSSSSSAQPIYENDLHNQQIISGIPIDNQYQSAHWKQKWKDEKNQRVRRNRRSAFTLVRPEIRSKYGYLFSDSSDSPQQGIQKMSKSVEPKKIQTNQTQNSLPMILPNQKQQKKEDIKKKKKIHLLKLRNVRFFKNIPVNDELILRNLFKKFSNGNSVFQNYSKLEGTYSTQNLKTLRSKVEKIEALASNGKLQKTIYKKYKVFITKNIGKVFPNRFEEIKKFNAFLSIKDLDNITLQFYIEIKFPQGDAKEKTLSESLQQIDSKTDNSIPSIQSATTLQQPIQPDNKVVFEKFSEQDILSLKRFINKQNTLLLSQNKRISMTIQERQISETPRNGLMNPDSSHVDISQNSQVLDDAFMYPTGSDKFKLDMISFQSMLQKELETKLGQDGNNYILKLSSGDFTSNTNSNKTQKAPKTKKLTSVFNIFKTLCCHNSKNTGDDSRNRASPLVAKRENSLSYEQNQRKQGQVQQADLRNVAAQLRDTSRQSQIVLTVSSINITQEKVERSEDDKEMYDEKDDEKNQNNDVYSQISKMSIDN